MGLTYDDEDDRDELDDAPRSVDERVRAAIEAADARLAQRLAETPTPEWRPPAPEPQPEPRAQTTIGGRSRKAERRRELPAWITLQIRSQAAAAVRRELRSEAKDGLAEQLGKVLAQERTQFRTITDALIARIAALETIREEFDGRLKGIELRSADTAPVLDLSDERARRRSGNAA